MTGGRSVLIVAQIAPPSSLVAARRVAAQCKYLARAGYEVTVLTSVASGDGSIEGAHEVVRTKDALTSGLNWRRGQFAALGGSSAETIGAVAVTSRRTCAATRRMMRSASAESMRCPLSRRPAGTPSRTIWT